MSALTPVTAFLAQNPTTPIIPRALAPQLPPPRSSGAAAFLGDAHAFQAPSHSRRASGNAVTVRALNLRTSGESAPRPKVAVVGGGIAGLEAARRLSKTCSVEVFEKNEDIAGQTLSLEVEGRQYPLGAVAFERQGYRDALRHFAPDELFEIKGGRAYSLATGQGKPIDNTGGTVGGILDGAQTLWEVVKYLAHQSPEDKRRPWNDTVEKLGLSHFEPKVRSLIQACGYTNGEVPTGYLHDYLDFTKLQSMARRPLLAATPGSDQYPKRLAAELQEKGVGLRPGQAVTEVKELPDRVELRVGDEVKSYDGVIMTGDAKANLELLANPSEARLEAYKDLKHEDYWVWVGDIHGLPDEKLGGAVSSFPENTTAERRGHPMLWLKKFADQPTYVVWSFNDGGGAESLQQKLEADFSRIEGFKGFGKVHAHKQWTTYFPHFSTESLEDGALDKVAEAEQGRVRFGGMGAGRVLSVMNLTGEDATRTADDLKKYLVEQNVRAEQG